MAVHSGFVTSLAKTFAGACTSGSLVIASCTCESFATTHTVTDNGTGSYVQDVQENTTSDANAGHGRATVNSKANSDTSALTVTVTFSVSTNHCSIQIVELTNAGGSPVFDSSGVAHQATPATSAMSMSITTATANCSIFCCAVSFDNTGITNDTSYTSREAADVGSASYHSIEDRVDSGAAGANTLTFGSTGNKVFAIAAAGYKPPSAAAATPKFLTLLGVGA